MGRSHPNSVKEGRDVANVNVAAVSLPNKSPGAFQSIALLPIIAPPNVALIQPTNFIIEVDWY
jgi:hypothetical protein